MLYTFDALYFKDVEISSLYLGDILVWTSETVEPPTPTYDETKVAVVLLDENDKPTDNVTYFETIADSAEHLKDNSSNRYLVHIGSDSGITSIYSSFYQCPNLVSIDVSDGITSIGTYAFYGCHALKNVNISSTVTSIADSAFESCSSIKSVIVPVGVSRISQAVFRYCTNLESVVLLGNVTLINYSAFDGCASLSSIVIPSTVTSIAPHVFDGCTSLESIAIPSSVTYIGEYAFQTSSLTKMTINKPENSISGAPWGATNATIIWTG